VINCDHSSIESLQQHLPKWKESMKRCPQNIRTTGTTAKQV